MDKAKTQSKEELLKSIEEVLNEALKEYEELSKMEGLELAEDPSRPMAAAPAAEEAEEEEAADQAAAEQADMQDREDDEDEGDEEEEKDDEKDDDALKSEFATLKAEMQKRGLLKSEQKTEQAEEQPAQSEELATLKKSYTDQIESLTKAVAALTEKVEKIAGSPVPRKGVSGLTPLRKSESEGQNLSKGEVINKLLELKKSGKAVDTALITRIETNRASDADFAAVKALIG